jgi:hypothetical protein
MLSSIPYLNNEEIDFFYDQLYTDGEYINKSKRTIELSLKGPRYSQTFEKDKEILSSLKKLDKILDILFDKENISTSRPNSVNEYETLQFGYEKTFATKLFFPKSKLSEIHGLNHLVVWVSDPNYDMLSKESWRFEGTFLYLIETTYDTGSYRTTLSGCSSLQVIANLVSGKNLFEPNWQENEPMGRGSYKHPIEKLKSIGALEIGKREIETIYRKRYLTNEQCFVYNNEKYRCNDLLAYPLFIEAQP